MALCGSLKILTIIMILAVLSSFWDHISPGYNQTWSQKPQHQTSHRIRENERLF